ncbi:alpha/beta-hydrolase [Laetiporus sulphureus 93-53]|uniref:carboxypeptidase C n=1 Tax=Laetiporus sulphureus 93-53 TaxID=1314785 RepID=A0A165IIP0_9APHY|nr:alpha/beta-hydrolase [Laetiporus sulphureus 93-53]KZT13130.1 alpha/beta-hydrolase [Laetiporus sulphureus 93-53]
MAMMLWPLVVLISVGVAFQAEVIARQSRGFTNNVVTGGHGQSFGHDIGIAQWRLSSIDLRKSLAFCGIRISLLTESGSRKAHSVIRLVYTGYLDVDSGAKHLFFYFFESRRDPAKDDVMMWINGGPGCSSSMGLLMELGPCSIDKEDKSPNGSVWNPYSWNAEADIFFLDQRLASAFLMRIMEKLSRPQKTLPRTFTHSSRSFLRYFLNSLAAPSTSQENPMGRYLPAFASYIFDRNTIAKSEGREILNLTSVLIGNGITDISTLYFGRYEIECGTAALQVPFQDISTWPNAQFVAGRNVYDISKVHVFLDFRELHDMTRLSSTSRKMCEGDSLCYKENTVIKNYLDRPSTRKILGVTSPNNFSACSREVGTHFNLHMDKWVVPSQHYVANLLERGVRMLIYAGTYDWQCNWVANKLWVDKLDWLGREAYNAEEWRDWVVNEKKAGETKKAGTLTFATVPGAGHMMSCIHVPHDKPAEAQAMVSSWLAEREF